MKKFGNIYDIQGELISCLNDLSSETGETLKPLTVLASLARDEADIKELISQRIARPEEFFQELDQAVKYIRDNFYKA